MTYRRYVGTFTHIQDKPWKHYAYRDNASLYSALEAPQQSWLDKHPSWKFWRDEFRRKEYHIYLTQPTSENNIMLAQILFTQSIPSHTPMAESNEWWENGF